MASYLPVDIHFVWQMSFYFDVFRVPVRCFWESRNMDFIGSDTCSVEERERGKEGKTVREGAEIHVEVNRGLTNKGNQLPHWPEYLKVPCIWKQCVRMVRAMHWAFWPVEELIIDKIERKRELMQTWGWGFVSVTGSTGSSFSHLIHCWDAEAVVYVPMELEQSRVVISRHSHQLLPAAWLPLALLIFNDELWIGK